MSYANADQKKMAAVWRSKAWKKRVKEVLRTITRCQWCNGYSKVINHRRQGYYEGYELCRLEEIDVICQGCHKYFTDTGKRFPGVLFDDCSSCNAAIYKGRKVCYLCGSDTIQIDVEDPEARARLLGILNRCPAVCVGDSWKDVWAWPGPSIVTGFVAPTTLPWPMVKTNLGDVGLPAYLFADLEKQGQGDSWKKIFFPEWEMNERPEQGEPHDESGNTGLAPH